VIISKIAYPYQEDMPTTCIITFNDINAKVNTSIRQPYLPPTSITRQQPCSPIDGLIFTKSLRHSISTSSRLLDG